MRIFVGNLSYQTTEEQLTELFSEAGPVESASIVTDRDTGRSRGFAFIEMDKDAAAASESISTKAKPRERPVSRSVTIVADSTWPASENISVS